jgi:hypothetical protein
MSAWIDHVKKYARDNNMKYSEALKNEKCKQEYHNVKPKAK